jgi:predicted RNase H-like HicB family nuclease
MKRELIVKANWDSDAKVWVAESDDVPGLVTEAGNMEQLIKKLKVIIPELLELNKSINSGDTIPFCLTSEYTDVIYG